MGGVNSGRRPSAESILRSQNQKFTPIVENQGDKFFLPNHSGDHSAGKVNTTPVNDTDIANKKYVDDNIGTHTESSTDTLTNKTIDDESNFVAADRIHEHIRNESGGAMAIGDAVFVSGFSVGQSKTLVDFADASASATMPCAGIIITSTIANNGNGEMIETGSIDNLDTSAWSAGDELYISTTGTTGNTLTSTKPTGATELVQKVAIVLRSHATMGVLEVFGAGRSNDSPNTIDIPGSVTSSDFFASSGAAATPSHSFESDNNSGMYSVAGDNLGFSVAGEEAVRINAAAQLLVENAVGTASVPQIAKIGDTNTGILFPAADTLAFTTAGSEAMRINSSGEVGIGTDSPAVTFHLDQDDTLTTPQVLIRQNGTGDAAFTFQIFGVTGWALGVDNSDGDKFKISQSSADLDTNNRFTIDTGGKIGIGTTSPLGNLHISDANAPEFFLEDRDEAADEKIWRIYGGSGNLIFRVVEDDGTTQGDIGFRLIRGTGATVNSVVFDSGNVGIGTTPATSAKLELSSTTGAFLLTRMTTTQRNALTAVNGMVIYNSTTNAFNFYENGAWVSGSGLA